MFLKMVGMNDLPGEMLVRLFGLVSLEDLKNIVLVNRRWRQVGEEPILWRKCVLTIHNKEDINKVKIRRCRRIRNICVQPSKDWDEKTDWEVLLRNVTELPDLREVEGLAFQNLFNVEAGLLGRVLTGLEVVGLRGSFLSPEQINAIIEDIRKETSKIKKLDLERNDLSEVDPEVLGESMSILEDVDLTETKLSTLHLTKIFTHVMKDSSKLKKINLQLTRLSDVDTELLAKGVNRMELVDLGYANLSVDHVKSILTHVMEQDSKLKTLYLEFGRLTYLDSQFLAKAVHRLEDVGLRLAGLSYLQITAILQQVGKKGSKLRKLDLKRNDLSQIEPKVLATSVNRLEEVDLTRTNLRTVQIASIFASVIKEGINLKKLNLEGNDLSGVDKEVLEKSVYPLVQVIW